MRLAIFDDQRLGAVVDSDAGLAIVDISAALPWWNGDDPLDGGWWRRMCRDFDQVESALEAAAAAGPTRPLSEVSLHAPVLHPSKIVAAASNYAAHVEEMHGVQERTLGKVESWMMDFDVFLKAPSSIVGPSEAITLPAHFVADGTEIHHESELVIIIGKGGKDIPEAEALDHVMGYMIGLDITVRSPADRSRRKSYDSFSPLGPWLTTTSTAGKPDEFDIRLEVDGETRQSVCTADLIVSVPRIIEYASAIMTLVPGDVIFTGAPPGVGPIVPGEILQASISGLGSMTIPVR
jgi:2-keto-4-pentenoate hydratase/2-oxohepta-3-ene-1,7-dioic acid hydratase in catechol pathway